jgi:hypothetical protein
VSLGLSFSSPDNPFARIFTDVTADLRKQSRRAFDEGAKAAQDNIRAQVTQAGLPPVLAKTWRQALYPKVDEKFPQAGFVWSRAPIAMYAFANGAEVLPLGKSKFLAIPTGDNRAGGRKAGVWITAQAMAAMVHQTFTLPIKTGPYAGRGKLWFLRLKQEVTRTKSGRRNRSAIAGGELYISGKRLGQIMKRRARHGGGRLLNADAVPLFLLVPQVSIAKRLDLGIAARVGADKIAQVMGADQ